MDSKFCPNCQKTMDTIWERTGFKRMRGDDIIMALDSEYTFSNWKCPKCGELKE